MPTNNISDEKMPLIEVFEETQTNGFTTKSRRITVRGTTLDECKFYYNQIKEEEQ